MTKIFVLHKNNELSENVFNFLLSLCDKGKVAQIMRKRASQDRENSVLGNALAKYAIKEAFGVSVKNIEFSYEESGKPYLNNGVYFSISHSGDMVACAVSDKPVGLDVQKKTSFTKKTAKLVSGNPKCSAEEFFSAWTKAEALFKRGDISFKEALNSVEKVKMFIINDYFISVTQ